MKTSLIVTAVFALILIGGYFALGKTGILPKSKLEYVKENSIQDLKSDNSEEQIKDQEIPADQPSDTKKEVVENKEDGNVAPLPEKVAPKPEKKVEEKKEDVKTTDDGNIGRIVNKLMTSGFKVSNERKIDTIIVHTSYNAIGSDPYDIEDIIKQYKQYEVSAHYLIGRDGIIYRLVEDKNIAWHAGVSKMPDGRTNVNDFSIGIEVVNTKEGKFSDAQYEALNQLIDNLKDKYPIKNILGHNDIAPGRKTDPWGIEWDKVKR